MVRVIFCIGYFLGEIFNQKMQLNQLVRQFTYFLIQNYSLRSPKEHITHVSSRFTLNISPIIPMGFAFVIAWACDSGFGGSRN